MVYKKSYRGQRTGRTIRKLHMYLQSTNEGFVDYKLKDRFFQFEPEKLQRIYNRKDEFFSDGRKMPPLLLDKEVDPELNDIHLNLEHRYGKHVVYSLNKYKRWTLPSVVQENIESLSDENFRVVLHERRSVIEKQSKFTFNIFKGGQCLWNDCVKYVDSKTPVSCARPGRSAASYFCDLRRKCMEEENTGKKPLSRKRIRHNMHSRGVQRKSELLSKRPKVENRSYYSKYMLLDGADNKDMAEFQYEICAPGKKTSRFKPSRDLREDRLDDRVDRSYRTTMNSKSLFKQKGQVNGIRQNWHKWYLRKGFEDESTQDTSVGCSSNRKFLVEFEAHQKNPSVCICREAECVYCGDQSGEEEVERMGKVTTMSVDILDCLKKVRDNKRTVKAKREKRKLPEKDWEFLNKKSRIVYLNDPSVEKTKEEDDTNNSNSAPLSESIAKDVKLPNFVKSFLRRSEIEDIFRQTPGISSTSSYPLVYLFPLKKSVKYDENENVSNLEWVHNTMNGDVPALEVQKTFGSTFSSPEQDIAEFRLRIVGNQQLYNTKKANKKLGQLLTTQEEYLMIPSASAVLQTAKDVVQQCSPDNFLRSILTKDPYKLCQMKSGFDWLPRLTYSVTTIQQASYKSVPSTSLFREVQTECPTQNMSGIKHEDECGVCFSSLGDSGKDSTEGVVILPCRHSFCRGCLLQYLVQNIMTGGRRISCMQYKCSSEIDPVTVRSLVPNRLFSQWVHRQQEQAVMSTGNWKWCPNSTCDYILSVVPNQVGAKIPRAHLRIMEVGCLCGTEFCLDCNELPHWPASCRQMKAYTKALDIQNDKDYMRSFKVNVKHCPLCKEKMDKNGGCNAMLCRCGHHFCWLCLKPNPYYQHNCKTVALQEIDIVSVKVLKFHVKFLELAYSYRVRCFRLIEWRNSLSRKLQVSAKALEKKISGIDQDKRMSRFSLRSSQVKHLKCLVETLKLLEKVYISISSTSQKSHAGREFKSLSNTVDFIINRLLELLQVPPNPRTDDQMNRLQNILSKQIKMLVLLSVYLQRSHSKKDTAKTPPTVRYQTVYN